MNRKEATDPADLRRSLSRWRIISWCLVAAVMLIVALGLAHFYRHFDLARLRAWAQKVNGGWVFAALVLLPLAGFPTSVLHLMVGLRFGLARGILLVALSIALQLSASFFMVHMIPGFFGRHLEPLRRRLPRAAHGSLTVFTILMPGAPYWAQNYVLPLAGVPFGTYFSISFPLHLLRSIVTVTVGHLAIHFTPLHLMIFGVYGLAVVLGWWTALRRLRAQLRAPQPAADDRRRHG